MSKFIKDFAKEETGAVTVDWVVLTAAIIFLGFIVGTMVSTATVDSGEMIGDTVGSL